MADVLDQSEVDALLAAVGTGSVPEVDPQTFNVHERAIPKDVHTYDFKRPERVSKDQMRALGTIHENFARNFGASLSGFLRTIVEVRMATIEQLTYSEFIHSLPNPTNFNLLSVEPLQGQMCLEISPLIVYPIIDRLLGGSSAELFIPQRPLTLIELRLIRRVTDRALQCLNEVWNTLVSLKFDLAEVESNPHLVQLVAPNEVVVVIGFEVKMEPRSGTLSLCIPFNAIEPIMPKLASQSWASYQKHNAESDRKEVITRRLQKAEVEITAYLAETTITLGELLSLQPGDIIQTAKPADQDLLLRVEGKNKFRALLGRYKENKAMRITRAASEEERM